MLPDRDFWFTLCTSSALLLLCWSCALHMSHDVVLWAHSPLKEIWRRERQTTPSPQITVPLRDLSFTSEQCHVFFFLMVYGVEMGNELISPAGLSAYAIKSSSRTQVSDAHYLPIILGQPMSVVALSTMRNLVGKEGTYLKWKPSITTYLISSICFLLWQYLCQQKNELHSVFLEATPWFPCSLLKYTGLFIIFCHFFLWCLKVVCQGNSRQPILVDHFDNKFYHTHMFYGLLFCHHWMVKPSVVSCTK